MEWWKKDFCLQSHTGYQASSFLLLLWYQRESLVWVLYLWKVIGIFLNASVMIQCYSLQLKSFSSIGIWDWFFQVGLNVRCTTLEDGGFQVSNFWAVMFIVFIVVELSVKWILDPSPGQAWRGKVVRNDPSPGKWLLVNNRTKTNSFFFRDFKASSLVRKNKSCAYEWVQMTALI